MKPVFTVRRRMNKEEYKEELKDMIADYTEDESLYINKADLVRRFVSVDEEYNHEPWNLMQILANVNMIVEKRIND